MRKKPVGKEPVVGARDQAKKTTLPSGKVEKEPKAKQAEEARDKKGAKQAKDAKAAKQPNEPKPGKQPKEPQAAKQAKESKATRQPKEPKPAKQLKEPKPAKQPKEREPAKQPKEPKQPVAPETLRNLIEGLGRHALSIHEAATQQLQSRVAELLLSVSLQASPIGSEEGAGDSLRAKMVQRIAKLRIKPERGRIKDLKRIDALLEKLEESLLPPPR